MVSLKLSPFRASFKPLKNVMSVKGKNSVRKQFPHVNCTDDEVSQYFKDAAAARTAMAELGQRSWEYQFEFAAEMAKRCGAMMGDDKRMHEALDVFENWYVSSNVHTDERLDKHSFSPIRRFPLLRNPTVLADLYPRAQRLVVSDEALQFALVYSVATSHKKPLHKIAVDKTHQLGPDLLSQRQRTLDRIVPDNFKAVELWDWECDRMGRLVQVPSRIHLEWLCWGYTPDEKGIWECGNRELGERLSAVL